MEFFFIGIGIVIGFLFGWLLNSNRASTKVQELRIENAELKKDKETDAEKIKWLKSAEEQLKDTFK